MAPIDGSYAPKSPDLSFLASSGSDQISLPPPPTSHQQPYGQHARTPSTDYSNQYRSAPAPLPNGAGYGGPPQHGFVASPSYAYSSLPPQAQPHITSPPPQAFLRQAPAPPTSQLHSYHDGSSYNNPGPPLPPFSPQQHHSPYQAASSSHDHSSVTPPQQHQHYHPLHHPPQQLGYSPPQQGPHTPNHLHSPPPPPPAGYSQTAFPPLNSYGQHAPHIPYPYSQAGQQAVPAGNYQVAQYSNPPSAEQSFPPPAHSSLPEMAPPKPAAPAKEPEIMFSPVKTKFPTARIKRIMQADEEVGKVAQQTPIAVGKALELFMVQLVTKSADVARDKNSKRITAQMLKQVIDSGQEWDFLQDIVAKVGEEKEGAKGSARAKAESETDEDIEPAEPKKRGRTGRKKKGAE